MVHLDTALGEQFLDVAVGQSKAQVPADRQDDDVGWEPEASEGRSCSASRARAAGSHAISLAAQAWPGERNRPPVGLRCSPLPPQRSAWLLSTTLSRACSGAGLRRLSLSRARSSAEMRHRRATLPRPHYVATTRVQVDGSVIQAIIRGPWSRCQQQRPVDRDGGSCTVRSGVSRFVDASVIDRSMVTTGYAPAGTAR
jgi:hypothetical protein